MAEVPVAPQHKGQSALHALAVREAELGEANTRLRRSGEFYDAVRAGAAAGGEGR